MTVAGGVMANAEGELAIVGDESTNVEGKVATAIPLVSFVVGGGGISVASILRFLPFGAGSRGGDRL